MEPENIIKLSWLKEVMGTIVVPPVDITCSSGAGKILDFAIISEEALHLVKTIKADRNSPSKTHFPFYHLPHGEPEKVLINKLLEPKKIGFTTFPKEDKDYM